MSKKNPRNPNHPKFLEAENNRRLRADARAAVAMKRRSLCVQFLHLNRYTLAYRRLGRRIIEVTTTIKHPTDRFDKLAGEELVLQRFSDGACILLRKEDKDLTTREFLKLTFDW